MLNPTDHRHGTNAGYKAGCREACCRAANAKRCAENRKRLYLTKGQAGWVSPRGVQRRIEALMFMGWRQADIAEIGGWCGKQRIQELTRRKLVHPSTVERVDQVYRALCMKRGPSPETRYYAKRKGYVGPLAWDDIDNDPEPTGIPSGYQRQHDTQPDMMIVRAVIDGARSPEGISVADRRAVALILRTKGWTVPQVAARLRTSEEVISKDYQRTAA